MLKIRSLITSNPLGFLLSLAFCLRIYSIQSPILGVHAWRQADTAAMARNFYENGYNFLYPQIDWGGNLAGYCQTEFPIYSFFIAILYKFFGVHESIGRLASIIFSLIAIYFFYKLCLEITEDKKLSFWSCFFYIIIPTNIYYSRTFQPESLVLMCAISGTYFFYKWIKNDQKKYLFTSSLLICLACLIKVVPAFYLSLPLIYLAWQKFKSKMFSNLNLYLYTFIIIIPTLAWYFHSYQIANEYGLSFGFGSERFGWNFKRLGIMFEQIIYFIAVRHLLVIGFIAMIFGIFCKREKKEEIFFDLLFISNILYILVFGNLNSFHEYYQLPLLIPTSIYIGKAFTRVSYPKQIINILLIIFLMAGSLFYSVEYITKENPSNSELFELAQIIKQTVPKNSLIVVTTGNDPTILYLSERKGWIPTPDQINPAYLLDRAKDGAKYLAGGYNFVQTYQLAMAEKDKKIIKEIVSKSSSQLLNSEKFFLVKL
ncbi:PMT family glycosyltransferase, 4-amino-4-deoxy-L-arabinose transferase [Synechococcus sp. PCC 7502]|uniref:ArnT family glycosyltransferase n=1 Tax=Synechococcus sp. PCC 7502 TaxID=1173263 RepID=UPI00029FEBEE|nr:glycosyltransferase family 39 protein [Synechococcus sp. PCC 7502]AFY72274.1 PMT family glycosyltransferase, 4-amino-4-deoxy-L-arabinose transferase [Synechococcus sp. PCC 7502]